MTIDGFPISASRLESRCLDRASTDADSEPWQPIEVQQFEVDFTTVPKTPLDLQRLAQGRIEDLQDSLINSDFAQGSTVALLSSELEVQVWVAEALRLRQGRSYSVERESRVVDEKEPDVRLRSKVTDAVLPIEIKVAESWSLRQLEEALAVQLVGKYLRDRNAQHGVLLLVHQVERSTGWQSSSGAWLTFEQVVIHLKQLAHKISIATPNAPQPSVAVLDVSKRTKKK